MFKHIALLYTLSFMFFSGNTASALEIQVVNRNADPGEAISMNITVGDYNQENIAAAALMLTYNTDLLSLVGVESGFFQTFSDQWNSLTPVPDPLPPTSVEVDGQTYTQPLLFTTRPGSPMGKTLLVGARVQSGRPSTIFTLHFVVGTSAPAGIYPISISPIVVNNVNAGYNSLGESIPIFVDTLENQPDPSQAYPAYSPTIINGAILVNTAITDSDSDGIDDSWEITHFGDLTTADQASDFDKDGYTDLQEYINDTAGYTDPQGVPYDPKVKNVPGGTGYIPDSTNSSFWTIMMPVILNSSNK